MASYVESVYLVEEKCDLGLVYWGKKRIVDFVQQAYAWKLHSCDKESESVTDMRWRWGSVVGGFRCCFLHGLMLFTTVEDQSWCILTNELNTQIKWEVNNTWQEGTHLVLSVLGSNPPARGKISQVWSFTNLDQDESGTEPFFDFLKSLPCRLCDIMFCLQLKRNISRCKNTRHINVLNGPETTEGSDIFVFAPPSIFPLYLADTDNLYVCAV